MRKPVVAFVCTHNACRSQIAHALARERALDAFTACSGGTHPAASIDADVMRLLTARYGLDTTGLSPASIDELPAIDILITMGCGVRCPHLPALHREDWGIPDPTGTDDETIVETMEEIEQRVQALRARVLAGAFDQARFAFELKALADPNRLRVLDLLSDGAEHCACELLEELDIAQSTLSYHMASLCEAGLTRTRKEGRWMHYELDRSVLCAVADRLAHIARTHTPQMPSPGGRPGIAPNRKQSKHRMERYARPC